ncbi:MAG TPA: PCRF domain-containing protein, partial [Acidimicrobiales bacterium]|nr:PCRF domain-containing protein [Acidimicrobiales bacterium]
MLERLAELEAEYEHVLSRLADPSVVSDQQVLRDTARRHKELEAIVGAYRDLQGATADLQAARDMYAEAAGEERDDARAEVDAAEAKVERLEEELRLLLLPSDPYDGKDVILEIRGAEGGEEANLFAKDLADMYARYAERKGWQQEVLSSD